MSETQKIIQNRISSIGNKINQASSMVQQSVPEPVNQTVKQGVSQIKQQVGQTAPQVKQEVTSYARNFQLTLSHLIFIGYFLAVFLRILFPFTFSSLVNFSFWASSVYIFLSWMIGGLVGWNFLFLDNFVYLYISYPESSANKEAGFLLKQKGVIEWFKFILTFKGPSKLALRSFLFQVSWFFLAFFALSSTNSLIGKGVVMGLGLHLLLENWQLQIHYPQILNTRLFWQIKRPVNMQEQKYFLYIFTALFAILSLLV